MLVRGDLGFVPLVIVVVLVVILVVLRRKWRIAVSKREEIRRLLVLAAEESARVEFEAKVEYSIVGESVEVVEEKKKKAGHNECALCFSPTKKLCSQCKAVYYWYGDFVVFLIIWFGFCDCDCVLVVCYNFDLGVIVWWSMVIE